MVEGIVCVFTSSPHILEGRGSYPEVVEITRAFFGCKTCIGEAPLNLQMDFTASLEGNM